MAYDTLAEFFALRDKCLCGATFKYQFLYSSMNNDYIKCSPLGSYIVNIDNRTIMFPFFISSRVAPIGDIPFDIVANIDSSEFKIQCDKEYLDFITNYFDLDTQISLKIRISQKCLGYTNIKSCDYWYNLNSGLLTFNFDTKKVTAPMADETFRIRINDHSYYFNSDFYNNTTIVNCELRQQEFILPKVQAIHLKLEKFLEYPFETEYIMNKLKTYLLFL